MDKKWWQNEVIYQIYPKSFKDTNGDGIGDLNGIREKLPYLHDLGITMIWICPMFPTPMADNGYDIADYRGVEPLFGTMADIDALIAEAKALDIKIILDLVVNHSSDEHPWFKEAIANPTSKYRDYYIFKKPVDGQPPNNWRSIFGGSVWEIAEGEQLGEYYFHTFHKKQPDLNWENPAVRQEVADLVNFWFERGVEGFRIDAIVFIKKDFSLTFAPDGPDGLADVNLGGANMPGMIEFLAELKERTFAAYDKVSIAEAAGVPYEKLDEYIGRERGVFDMMFDFKTTEFDLQTEGIWTSYYDWDVKDYKAMMYNSQVEVGKHGWATTFISNHDQPRAASKYLRANARNPYAVKALATTYFFVKGTPFVYQGQELGMVNFKWDDIYKYDDISTIDQYERALLLEVDEDNAIELVNRRSRDNTRTPMPWDDSENAGFTTGTPWLPLTETYDEINVKAQEGVGDSVFSYYKEMIALRQHSDYSDTLIYGDFEPLPSSDDVFVYKRVAESNTIIVIANWSEEIQVETIPELGDIADIAAGKVVLSNYAEAEGALAVAGNQVTLRPFEAAVIAL